jgi:hypothetical protein
VGGAEMNDVSPLFKYNETDAEIVKSIMPLDKTPQAVIYFAEHCGKLTNYAYWFMLSTLWVSYTGFSDIKLWKQLFGSKRNCRMRSIMKPSEVEAFAKLPSVVEIYRAKRPNETEWIAYTLDFDIAKRFARERGVKTVHKYEISKNEVIALFLRRGEREIIVLDESKPKLIAELEVPHGN